jgi:lysophospholipase L1-like esterase
MANRVFGLLVLAALGATAALAHDRWVATWAAAQQQPGNPAPPPAAQPAPPANGGGRGQAAPTSFHNQTIRMIIRSSALGGQKLRLQLSNAYGTAPLAVGAVHVARHAKDSEIAAGTDRPVTFSGKTAFSIPPGAVMVSDAVELAVPALAELAVSVYVPEDSGPLTRHGLSLRPTYVSKDGDFTSSGAIPDATIMQGWSWLSEIDVLASGKAAALVTFGDSITDGARSTPETDHSWPNMLAQRLAANRRTANVGLANEGIAGNRVLVNGVGTNALGRFDRDAISVAGVKWLTVLEGINDIGRGATADDVIAGLRQMIERARTHGIRVIGCTITPFEGANYYTEQGEQARAAVNQWIRNGKAFDAVVDFDAATRDASDAKKIRAEFDSGDHLHPNDAGYKAMAEAVDLRPFR